MQSGVERTGRVCGLSITPTIEMEEENKRGRKINYFKDRSPLDAIRLHQPNLYHKKLKTLFWSGILMIILKTLMFVYLLKL